MIFTYQIHGIPLQTGDIICTTDGKPEILAGEFWRLLGRLLPGDVDHIVMYTGPGGSCVEAGALGVITFEFKSGHWNSEILMRQRGMLVDTFYGVAYPLQGLGLSTTEEENIRADVAAYCLAQLGKPYNLNFLDPETESAFYCSQLAYKAYLRHGINLNKGLAINHLPGTERIVFPQEIWDGCAHRLATAHAPGV